MTREYAPTRPIRLTPRAHTLLAWLAAVALLVVCAVVTS